MKSFDNVAAFLLFHPAMLFLKVLDWYRSFYLPQ
jgi:hypothetical protein